MSTYPAYNIKRMDVEVWRSHEAAETTTEAPATTVRLETFIRSGTAALLSCHILGDRFDSGDRLEWFNKDGELIVRRDASGKYQCSSDDR